MLQAMLGALPEAMPDLYSKQYPKQCRSQCLAQCTDGTDGLTDVLLTLRGIVQLRNARESKPNFSLHTRYKSAIDRYP